MTRRASLVSVALVMLLVAACGGGGTSAAPSQTAVTTPEPSDTPEPPASDTPQPAPSEAPASAAESAAPPSEAPAADELNWELAANFGSTTLTAGFTPDPFEHDVRSGGPIDASYLGGDCRGWATAAPDYDVTYESGSMTLLRFYFVADTADDTTLIINAPDGSWHCNDDAPGTIDPMVDFTSPQAGLYDVWIGSYEEGASIDGTLYVTELSSNSP